jgi:4'-phosphopantetheinyl transferase
VVGAAPPRAVVALRAGIAPERVATDRRCARCGRAHRRPRVVGRDVEVSVSLSGPLVVIAATSGGRVAVDVERVGALDRTTLSGDICRPAEARPDLGPVSRFAPWTRKVSVLEAAGVGLDLPMVDVGVTATDEAPRPRSSAGDDMVGRW